MIEHDLVYVVDDDQDLAASVARLLRRHEIHAEPFTDPAALLDAYGEAPAACVLTLRETPSSVLATSISRFASSLDS